MGKSRSKSTLVLGLSLCIFCTALNFINFYTVHVRAPSNDEEIFDVDFSVIGGDAIELQINGHQGEGIATSETRLDVDTTMNAPTAAPVQTAQTAQGSHQPHQEQQQLLRQNSTRPERFAYAYLIAGCVPEQPSYLGYIYNIVVAKRLLVERGSKEDVIIMVRMHSQIEATSLPPEHEQILIKSGIIVKYIPKSHVDNFHTAMIDKFRILKLTEYSRILYLDADAIGIWNLDYMFHLSCGPDPKLEENVILGYKTEPANGGFFMLKPDEQDYERLMEIVKESEKRGYDFNETLGFGHIITPPDFWETYKGEKGTKWDWHGAYTDQGLLYHWTKYEKKKVSIIIKDKVQRWGRNELGEAYMLEEKNSNDIFEKVPRFILNPSGHHKKHRPYADFEHFQGDTKPWLPSRLKEWKEDIKSLDDAKNTNQLWFYVLSNANKDYGLGIDMETIGDIGRPILGLFPTKSMVHESKNARNVPTKE